MSTPNARLAAVVAAAQDKFAASGGTAKGRKRERRVLRRQWTRQIIKTDRLDKIEWFGNQDKEHAWYTSEPIVGIRNDPDVDAAINDLYYGDLKNPDDRPEYLNGPELLQDIFFSFLLATPKLHKKAEVVKDARLNGKFVEQMMALPAFEDIRDYSIGDPETAKEAMLALVDVIKEMIKQHREAVEQANEDRKNDSGGNDPFSPPGGGNKESWDEETPGNSQGQGKGDNSGASQFGENEQDDAEQQPNWDHREEESEEQERSESSSGDSEQEGEGDSEGEDADNPLITDGDTEFDDELDGEYEHESDWQKILDNTDFGRMANATLEQFADDLQELQEVMAGIGLTPEEWKTMDPKSRMKMAQRLNTPRMRKIADMVGRMKRFAQSRQAQKVIDSPHEIYTIEQGNDLARTVRSEFGLLGLPETRIWFYYKFFNGELLQYKKRGHEDVGKGPIICCIDNSGSMSGTPEEWAKGVAEALRRIAAEQDRDFYAIYFETNTHRERFDFPKGKGPFEKIMSFLSVSAGGGPLRVDQRIATPTGWKPIGEAQVGDLVIGPDGKATRILGVYPQGELDLHRVTFSDGASVVCDMTHLWTVDEYNHNAPKWRRSTMRLSEITDKGLVMKDGRSRFKIPILSAPIELCEADDLLVEPYLLGYMLGDGSFAKTPTIATGESELPWMAGLPAEITPYNKETREGRTAQYRLPAGRGNTAPGGNPLTNALRELGLWNKRDSEKFIPERYLWASVEQRLALLQGLLDTDGSGNVAGSVFYHTTSSQLADGVVHLVQSLGGLARITKRHDSRPGTEHWKDGYRITVRVPQGVKPYRLARRLVTWEDRKKPLTRSIVAVEPVGSGDAICIKVDRSDGLFVTEGMAITHNTQFDGVLTEALQKAISFGEGTPEHGKSDIVFITDGQAHLDAKWIEDFNDKRKDNQVRVFSIYISAYDSDRSASMDLLRSFSDVAIPVKALEVDDQTTAELFISI